MTTHRVRIPSSAAPTTHGFTLVEILIVVAILGILAAMVVPQFTSAAEQTRNNSRAMDVNRIRTQIQIYRAQHKDRWPTLADFVEQMTQASNPAGATAAPGTTGYPLGPYLREIPNNPVTLGNSIGNGAPGTSDWYYDESSGDFRANDSADARKF